MKFELLKYPLWSLGLLLMLSLVSCKEEEQGWEPVEGETPQTLLCYLSGQSLLRYFKSNIEEMREVVDRHTLYNSRLLVYVQPSSNQSLLLELAFDYATQSSRTDTLRRYEGCSSIEKSHMVEVLHDVVALAPAQQYGMLVGSHGAGWVPKAWTNLRESESGGESDAWSASPADCTPFDLLIKSPGAEATRWLGEHRGESTDISTWAEAFEEAQVELEYLIFDACFMSNIEALYELRHAARYIVASPTEIMGRGMNYATALPYLFVKQGAAYDLMGFCTSYYGFYATTTETRQSGCIALAVGSELEPLAEASARLMQGATREVEPLDLQVYDGLADALFYDFKQYMESYTADEGLWRDFEAQFDLTFPAEYRLHTPEFYSGYNGDMNPISYYSGVSTSAPSQKYPVAYASCAWQERMAR